MNIFSCTAVVLMAIRRSRRGRSFDKTDYILSSFFMEKLEFPISNRGRVGFLAAPLRRKIIEREEGKLDEGKERKKKENVFVPFVSTTCHDFRRTNHQRRARILHVSSCYGGERREQRVGGCIKAGYEANHGADGNKYFIASKTYHLPIERMNYSV